MPWNKGDARGFTKKAKSDVAKRQWRDVANDALKRGQGEASAIKQANAVVARRSRAGAAGAQRSK